LNGPNDLNDPNVLNDFNDFNDPMNQRPYDATTPRPCDPMTLRLLSA
jgi:hypothetical protein